MKRHHDDTNIYKYIALNSETDSIYHTNDFNNQTHVTTRVDIYLIRDISDLLIIIIHHTNTGVGFQITLKLSILIPQLLNRTMK